MCKSISSTRRSKLTQNFILRNQSLAGPVSDYLLDLQRTNKMSTNYKLLLPIVSTLYIIIFLRPAFAQDYQLIVNRDPSEPLRWNRVVLRCRDLSTFVDHSDYFFWINSADNDIRRNPLITYSNATEGLVFSITREVEGNFYCGPNRFATSPKLPLVAYPTVDSSLLPKRVSAQVGMTAILDPIIGPGALLSRYSIDWKQINGSNSVTVARIAGPRSINPVNDPDMKYSVHPSSFALMINSVSYADRGSYRGVLYVTDPEGEQYVYDQDLIPTTTLDVYVPPSFTEPPKDKVVSLDEQGTVTFLCVADGFPAPTIVWYHNREETTSIEKYGVRLIPGNDEFTTTSVLTMYSLENHDSGNVSCIAMVTIDGSSVMVNSSAHLSVLGDLLSTETYITTNGKVIFNIHLAKPLEAEVRLYLLYLNMKDGSTHNRTTLNKYRNSELITYFDTNPPFETFRVNVALVYKELSGPVFQDRRVQDTSEPTCADLENTIVVYVVPAAAVVACIALIVLFLIVCIVCCKKPMMKFFFKINSNEAQAVVTADHLTKDSSKEPSSPLPAGGPPAPNQICQTNVCEDTVCEGTVCRRRSLKSWCTKLCGYERSYNIQEKEAVETVRRARELLKTHPNGYNELKPVLQ